jgi:RimJ/RimL family protein N-acetyltransferase
LEWWLGWYERSERYGFWAAVEKSTGRFVGWFHLRPGDGAGPDEPELGYRLRREVWGRGYATEGSLALIDKAFTELRADRVYASTMAVNVASRRVMEKAGTGAPDSHTVRTWTSHRWRTVGAVAAIHSVHSVRPRIVVAAWFVGAPVARMLIASRLGVL